MANGKREQHGVEQHLGVWSSAVSAAVWDLPQSYLESGVLHPSGSLVKCLGITDGKWGFPQEPISRWSHSADMAVLITCVDILGVSPCQMCLT